MEITHYKIILNLMIALVILLLFALSTLYNMYKLKKAQNEDNSKMRLIHFQSILEYDRIFKAQSKEIEGLKQDLKIKEIELKCLKEKEGKK